jgi:ketosteroid isomerase-like protein
MTPATASDAPARTALTPSRDTAGSAARNRRVAHRLFEGFSQRDLPSILDLVHPEIIFQPMTAAITQAGEPYRGHEGLWRYIADVQEHWQELTVHPVQIRAAGEAVVVLGMASGRPPGGSFENAPATWILKFSDGLVVHIQIFSDARHVVEALDVERI